MDPLRRKTLLALAAAALAPRAAWAFGEEGAVSPRILLTGDAKWEGIRTTAPARWSAEIIGRTSAPARLAPGVVRADDPALIAEPFAVWGGEGDIPPLTETEVASLQRFVALGGVLFVDDFAPENGEFGKAARREIARVIPDGATLPIGPENVVFRSFYLLTRAVGRVEGPAKLDAIVRGGLPQVLFSSHDLLGALARTATGVDALGVTPGGERQREGAVRLAVNIALFVLCSSYKDDQVHARFLMRRRGSEAE